MLDIISKAELSTLTMEDLQIEKFVKKLNKTLKESAVMGYTKCNVCVSSIDQSLCETYNGFFDLVYTKFEIDDLKSLLDKVMGRLEYLGYTAILENHTKNSCDFYTIRITW